MKLIAVDTETHLWAPLGTKKVNLRIPRPDVVCTTWAREPKPIVLSQPGTFPPVTITRDTSAGLIMWDEPDKVVELFNEDDATYVFHNVAFDLGVLVKAYPDLEPRLRQLIIEGRILDTRVMYLMRDPDPPTKGISLAYVVKQLLGEDLDKGAVRTSFSRHTLLSKEQRKYAEDDAIVTLRIAQKMLEMPYGSVIRAGHRQKHIAAKINTDLESPDVVYSSAAAWMTWNLVPVGMAIDRVELDKQHANLTEKVSKWQELLLEYGVGTYVRLPGAEPIDCGQYGSVAPALVRKWTYDPLARCMRRVWKGRIESIDAKFKVEQKLLREIALETEADNRWKIKRSAKTQQISLRSDDWKGKPDLPRELSAYMEYQRWAKYLSSYTRPLIEAEAREVFPNYFVPGAATGRWACSKPNAMNVPKTKGDREGLRGIYVARPGHKFISADYPTLELFTLAQTMYDMGIDGPLRETLNSGVDIHTRTAALMNHCEESEVDKAQRQVAKMCNFGLPGGMGAKAFLASAQADGYDDWTYWEARGIRQRWLNTYWDVAQYLKQLDLNPWDYYRGNGSRLCKLRWLQSIGVDIEGGDDFPSNFEILQTLQDGRLYTATLSTGRVIPDRRYSMVANCFFQGLGADIITRAFNTLSEECWSVCAVVHDSIMLEVEPTMTESAKHYLNEAMKDALAEVCPALTPRDMDVEVLDRWT